MSAQEWWMLAAVLLGFLSAACALAPRRVPTSHDDDPRDRPGPGLSPAVAKLGGAALSAAVACIAAGLLVYLP